MSRKDDAPCPQERETLWPAPELCPLPLDQLEARFGKITRRTRLTIPETCAALACTSARVRELIEEGHLDATDMRGEQSKQPAYRVYRYSVVLYLYRRADRGGHPAPRRSRSARPY